jgi:type 1 glutamine amidotransferase
MPDPAAAGRGGRGAGFRGRSPDVILLFDQIYDMPPENQSNLQRYIEAGKGVIVLHNALTDYQRWPFWYRDVVGGSFLQNRTEELTMKTEKGPAEEMLPDKPATSPDKMIAPGVWDFKEYTVYPVGSHPIIRNIQRFTVRDEKYKNVWQAKNITPVLQTDDSDSDKVVGWIGPHPKAKVFAFMLGHSAEAHAHPAYRKIVHNAVVWAAGRLS